MIVNFETKKYLEKSNSFQNLFGIFGWEYLGLGKECVCYLEPGYKLQMLSRENGYTGEESAEMVSDSNPVTEQMRNLGLLSSTTRGVI